MLAALYLTKDNSCVATFELSPQASKKIQVWTLQEDLLPQNVFVLNKSFLLVAGHFQEAEDVNTTTCASIYTPNLFESSKDTTVKRANDVISFSNTEYTQWPEDLRFSLARLREQ